MGTCMVKEVSFPYRSHEECVVFERFCQIRRSYMKEVTETEGHNGQNLQWQMPQVIRRSVITSVG